MSIACLRRSFLTFCKGCQKRLLELRRILQSPLEWLVGRCVRLLLYLLLGLSAGYLSGDEKDQLQQHWKAAIYLEPEIRASIVCGNCTIALQENACI
jgi:hypothetical protein